MELANESQLFFKGKMGSDRAIVSQSIKAVLGWKFQVQDLLHEPKVLPLSLAHLVAQMGWAHAKGPKETDSYPPNHTSSISTNMSHGLGPCLKEYNIIKYIN